MIQNVAALWQGIRPGWAVWRGAAIGLLVAEFALIAIVCAERVPALWGHGLGLLTLAGWIGIAIVGGTLLFLLFSLLARLPRFFRWALFLAVPVAYLGFSSGPPLGTVLASAACVALAAMAAGAGAGALIARDKGGLVRVTLAVMTLVGGTGFFILALRDTFGTGTAPVALDLHVPPSADLDRLKHIGEKGPYSVGRLTYGSGSIRYAEYGVEADLHTDPVDGSVFLREWKDRHGWARTRYWGFGPEALPLNGLVWYPEGDGPFPLVLIVHGNHSMETRSERGYAYLAEHLASQGYIAVSADENFLNSSLTDTLSGMDAGLTEDNNCRGWLLLEHLRCWRAWNNAAESPFHHKVDLEHIALIGHSRGGEAITIAAYYNQLAAYPLDGNVKFDYHFNIRALVGIAPAADQYRPGGREIRLQDLSYLTLHGSQDGDVRAFDGLRAYDRIALGGAGQVKAAVYLDRANHGRFNTEWGEWDLGGFWAWALDRGPLLPEALQQQAAKVLIASFLGATLQGHTEYRAVLRQPAAYPWASPLRMQSVYQDSSFVPLCTYEEDADPRTGTAPGAVITGEGLSIWREQKAPLRFNGRESVSVYLAWKDAATYTVSTERPVVTTGRILTFTLADANELPEGAEAPEGDTINLGVEAEDAAGRRARLPLSRYGTLYRQFANSPFKPWVSNDLPPGQAVPQSFLIPLVDFAAEPGASGFGPLRAVRFVFDQTAAGTVILDDLGLQAE